MSEQNDAAVNRLANKMSDAMEREDDRAVFAKTSSWSDAERERTPAISAPVVPAGMPTSFEEACANMPPPAWVGAFEAGDLIIHHGWFARVYGAVPVPSPDGGTLEWMVLVKPEQPTAKERKRVMAAMVASAERGPVKL